MLKIIKHMKIKELETLIENTIAKVLKEQDENKPLPSIFTRTIYRMPTDEEIKDFANYDLSGNDVENGLFYTIVGRGILDDKNKRLIVKALKRVTEIFPDDKSFKAAYDIGKGRYTINPPISMEKLKQYANAISVICNGEYGSVYYNPTQQHVYVCLGDSNPFDLESLMEYIRDAIKDNGWIDDEKIKVTIENECMPTGDGWFVYDDYKKHDFIPYKY